MSETSQLVELRNLSDYKSYLQTLRTEAEAQFLASTNVREVVNQRAQRIDLLLQRIWSNNGLDQAGMALLAVGGYGRGELHPYSDIDIAILLDLEIGEEIEEQMEERAEELERDAERWEREKERELERKRRRDREKARDQWEL